MSVPAPEAEEKSILEVTKAALGLAQDYDVYDVELTIHINTFLSNLSSLGLGPAGGFEITGYTETWSDFLGQNGKKLSNAKTYMYLSVRLVFDPPDQYFVIDAFKEQIAKQEFYLSVEREEFLTSPVATVDEDLNLELTAGLPYSIRFVVSDAALVWPTLADFEVRSQIREEKNSSSRLLGDLQPYITPSIVDDDIVLDLAMTGAQTGHIPEGYYDIVLSDPGPNDQRATPVASGRVKVGSTVTAPANG